MVAVVVRGITMKNSLLLLNLRPVMLVLYTGNNAREHKGHNGNDKC